MVVKSLLLENFRNYSKQSFEFSKGLNVICGRNAQGKTNCVEAVFLLCTGYSPRVKKDVQVIKYGEESAHISATALSNLGEVTVKTDFYKTAKKKISINGVVVLKIGEILGNISAVFFNPSELKLVQEAPEDRRRFLDISISQMNKRYFYALQRYKKILIQRNNLLKEPDKEMVLDTVSLWDYQLAEAAGQIIFDRNNYLKKLSPLANEAHSFLTNNKEVLDVSGNITYGNSVEEISKNMYSNLQENLEKDMIRGFTSIGPHRDDIKLLVNDEDVKTFGSQGQQRTVSLSLKLAELEIFKERFNEYPTLILDDAFSELDFSRREKLLERIKNIQTIITCTEPDEELFSKYGYNKIVIDGGKIL